MLRNDLAGIMAGRRKRFVSILIAAQSRVSLASRPYRVLPGGASMSSSKVPPRNAFQREAREIRAHIKRFDTHTRLSVREAIAAGQKLARVKAQQIKRVGRGHWLEWLHINRIQEDRAERFMHIAERKDQFRNLRNLSLAALIEVAHRQTSQDIVDDIVRRSRANEKITAKGVRALRDAKTVVPIYRPAPQPAPTIAPAVPPSQLVRQARPTELRIVGFRLQKVIGLIKTACAAIDQIETPPTVAEIVAAVREQQIDLSVSLARKLARLFKALGDELARGVPTDDDDEHDVPTPLGHTRH
jgi:hypothetical protein